MRKIFVVISFLLVLTLVPTSKIILADDVATLSEAIKEQQTQIEELKAEMEAMKEIITKDGGNVGIGTTDPTYPLDVRSAPALGSSQITAVSNSNSNNSYGGFLAISSSGRGLYMNVADLSLAGPHYMAHVGDATIGATANAKLHLRAGATDLGGITIATNGDVGIGETEPTSKLHIAAGSGIQIGDAMHLSDHGSHDLHLQSNFADGNIKFYTGGGASENERLRIRSNGNVGIGTTNPKEKLDVAGTIRTKELEITGGSDIAERFDVNLPYIDYDINKEKISIEPGMVTCIDPKNQGNLIISSKTCDKTVVGVISGAGGVKTGVLLGQSDSIANGKYSVALSGRVYCKVDASRNPVNAGDFLTTSDIHGYAMKVTNYDEARGAIIGKAMTGQEEGKGLVLVLISLQ